MASVTLQLLCLLAFYVTINESCRADQCKLLPPTPDISSKFHSLASENGVRIIYLSLKVGNSSYRPLDLENVFFPERWVWANSISEPMLSMGYDYDILSLSLLSNQARSMDVHLIEEPSGCLADLNSSCQSTVVGKALLEKVTGKNSDKSLQRTDVACVAMIGKAETDNMDRNIEYRCCEVDNGEKKAFQPPLHCDLGVKQSKLFTAFHNVLLVAASIILFYCPAFPFALPEEFFMNIADEIKKEREASDHESREDRETTHGTDYSPLQNENETLSRQDDAPSAIPDEKDDNLAIPVDDTSPITCSVLLRNCATKLPGFQLSFNIKLVFLSYFVVPIFLYIIILLTLALKGSYLQEALRKPGASLGGIAFFLLNLLRGYNIIFSSCFFLAPFVVAVCVKPTDLIEDVKASFIEAGPSITYRRTLGQRICMNLLILQDKVHEIFSSSSKSFLNGLEKFLDFTIRAFIKRSKYTVRASRMKRLLCALCVLILSLLGFLLGVVFGGIFLAIIFVKTAFFVVFLSPTVSVLGFLCRKLFNELVEYYQCRPSDICPFIVTSLVSSYPYVAIVSACTTVTFSCFLIIEVFGYTLMGLILNADIATPYAVFALVAATNVYLCYANLQNRYKEAKEIISKEWHKNKGLLRDTRYLANNTDNTLPKELFWFVCGEDLNAKYTILPIQTEIFHMFRNMICILGFLFLSLSAVIFFSDLYQLSPLASSIAVFVTGVIPKLFLQGLTRTKTLGGWEKIKITRQVEKAVKEYIDNVNNGERPRVMPEEFMLRNIMYTHMPQ